jgi:hypothetical protein
LGQNAEKTPASAALTPAKAKTSEGQSSAMIGGAFIQGEAAGIYANPPANYQMYPRSSPTGVEEPLEPKASIAAAWETAFGVARPRSDLKQAFQSAN